MLLDKRTYQKLKQASYVQMLAFITEIYKQGFEDGANADVDPNIKYIAVKEGTEYICGNCKARLEIGELSDPDETE